MGCGMRDEQRKLIRLTVTSEGQLKIDDDQGRGGYLHRHPECWRAFLSRKSHYRAFHVEISREQRERLIQHLKGRDQE
jgi:predicted RNA-binding protein YlxR (DUF448 family)